MQPRAMQKTIEKIGNLIDKLNQQVKYAQESKMHHFFNSSENITTQLAALKMCKGYLDGTVTQEQLAQVANEYKIQLSSNVLDLIKVSLAFNKTTLNVVKKEVVFTEEGYIIPRAKSF